jgi:hypothetical protein
LTDGQLFFRVQALPLDHRFKVRSRPRPSAANCRFPLFTEWALADLSALIGRGFWRCIEAQPYSCDAYGDQNGMPNCKPLIYLASWRGPEDVTFERTGGIIVLRQPLNQPLATHADL